MQRTHNRETYKYGKNALIQFRATKSSVWFDVHVNNNWDDIVLERHLSFVSQGSSLIGTKNMNYKMSKKDIHFFG